MELTIENLIKIILGIAVVAIVIGGLFFFGNYAADFFKNLPTGKIFLHIIK